MPPIVITGMHRSGTSLVAEILVRAGVHFGAPENWLPADAANPRGYFEDRRVVDIDERLLQLWKGTWDEPPVLPPDWLESALKRPLAVEASAWRDSVATERVWGWKDPRASLLLPFWRRLVPELQCVMCIRDPVEVAHSLARRNRTPLQKAAFLWLHYLTENLEGIGDARCTVVFYGDLLHDPGAQVRRLLEFSGASVKGALEEGVAVVDPSLRRQRGDVQPTSSNAPLDLCRSIYVHLKTLLADGETPPAPAIGEAIRAGRAALALLVPSPEERHHALEIHFSELELAQGTVRDLRIAYERAAALAGEKEQEVAAAREAIVARDHQLEASARALAERTADCATLGVELRLAQETARDLRIAYERAAAELRLAQETARDLRIAYERAAALAGEKEQEVAAAREAIVARDHQLEASERALAERTADCALLEQLKIRHEAELTTAKHELASQDIALSASRSQAIDLAAKVTELEHDRDRDEDTIKELHADLASWQERKQRVLGLIATRIGSANGSWRSLFASRRMNRAEATLMGGLIGESRLLAHFDQPIFGDVEEGEVRFTGWCLHPARELVDLRLRLNDVPFPTRFGLDRPDVGAAFPDAPGSAHSGFLISVPMSPGRYLVTLEAHCRDLGPDVFVAPDMLVVKRRPAWRRIAARLRRNAGFWSYAASKLRRRLAHGRGFPPWKDIPAQVRRARQEFLRRRHSDSGVQPPDGFTPPTPLDPYDAWLAVNPWGPSQEEDLRHRLKLARNLPRISVVTPVYRPDLQYFQQTADSVCGQVYENWEWCLADDCSNDEGLTAKLRELTTRDARVRFVTRSENGHISIATNSAAALAHGEYIALLDHDDLLSPDCLAEVALYLAAHPDVDVLYTDDDKVDIEGRRYGPQFKPDWSPESLLSQMYFSHLLVVRRSLYEEVGGMRAGFEGSQDHDLALRVVEKARAVAHLPLVLYHWRAVPGSTALSGEAKLYSFDAGIRAVSEALARRGVPAEVDRPDWAVQARASLLRHGFPDDGPRVAILIATRNQATLLDRCVESLSKTRYRNFETVVLDDHSDEPETIAWLDAFPGTVLRVPGRREGFNFSRLHNHAARSVDAEYLLFLNNDTEVLNPAWLSQMMGFARLRGVGAVGARLLFPDDTVQHAGILHGFNQGSLALAFRGLPREHPGYLAAARVCRNYGAVTAACMLTPRRLFLELGGFDERDFAVSFNDVDYCYRLLDHGYRCVYAAEAELYHHEGATRGIGSRVEEVARFRQRYGHRDEPYYNPNLSTTSEHFEVRPRRLARRTGRPVKALMTSHTLDLTGAPFCQFEMAAALRAEGCLDPVVISPEDGPLRSWYEECGIPVRIFPNGMDKVGSLADYERELAEFARQVLEAGVEVVYGNTLKTFFAIDAARRLNLPSLWNIRESEPWQTYYSYLPDAVACRALECFSFPYRVLFVSNASRAVFEPLNSRHNFQVIHDGLDLERWEVRLGESDRPTSRQRLGVSADELVVVLLGTVCERKGQHDLVNALAQSLPEVTGRLRCFVVGDRESYPRVTLEAMACGLPIISTPVFGLSEQLVDEVNALLYQPGDIAALVAALARLAGDAALRKTMGSRSRAVLAGLKSFTEMTDDYGIQFMEAREAR